MKTKIETSPKTKELNAAIERFDALTGGKFDTIASPQALHLICYSNIFQAGSNWESVIVSAYVELSSLSRIFRNFDLETRKKQLDGIKTV